MTERRLSPSPPERCWARLAFIVVAAVGRRHDRRDHPRLRRPAPPRRLVAPVRFVVAFGRQAQRPRAPDIEGGCELKRLCAFILAVVVVAGCGSSSKTKSGSTNTGPPGSGSPGPNVTVAPAPLTDPTGKFTYQIQAKSHPVQETTNASGRLASPGTYYWLVNATIRNTDADRPAPWPALLTGGFQGSHATGSAVCNLTSTSTTTPPDAACYFYTNTLNQSGLKQIPAGQTVSVAFETRDQISATVNPASATFLVALEPSVALGNGVPLPFPS